MQGKSAQENLQQYIRTSASIHQDRMDCLKEANQLIAVEYKTVQSEIELVREDQHNLNQQIDALINSFSLVDVIQADIARTQANIQLIGKTVNRINKRIIELKKNKSKKK